MVKKHEIYVGTQSHSLRICEFVWPILPPFLSARSVIYVPPNQLILALDRGSNGGWIVLVQGRVFEANMEAMLRDEVIVNLERRS